jgi:tRNA threonylcarbamoyl adenosine modification protein (Sua5/YciO/YrdC/YwlC family)
MFIEINPKNIDKRLVKQVVEQLKAGEICILPTDAVYVLACDLKSKKGLNKLADWKQMKLSKAQFSIVCNDLSQVSEYVKQLDRNTFRLLKHNLPGPFTFILDATNDVSKLFDSNKKEIGIRIPDNQIILEIVSEIGNPICVTTLIDVDDEIQEYFVDPTEIYERFEDNVALIVDGGLGKIEASTIVKCTEGETEIIRQGVGIIEL